MEIHSTSFREQLHNFLITAFKEDVGNGDHTSMACIDADATGEAKLLFKDNGIVAGIDLAEQIFRFYDPDLRLQKLVSDGDKVSYGDTGFIVKGRARSILSCERIVLNCLQRLSGIATRTRAMTEKISGTKAKLLDTRKTTPGMRFLEKWAVTVGGGHNHRFGLYDMIMIKDNHVDQAGGIEKAIRKVQAYLREKNLNLYTVLEVRNFEEINEVMSIGGVNRLLIDNFSPEGIKEAVLLIDGRFETEASGGITDENIRAYAETGVDYISSGSLTQSVKNLDISLKIKV
jgi:nicotinate-nucleotide pyrophosphorylase (carboxylating)